MNNDILIFTDASGAAHFISAEDFSCRSELVWIDSDGYVNIPPSNRDLTKGSFTGWEGAQS